MKVVHRKCNDRLPVRSAENAPEGKPNNFSIFDDICIFTNKNL